MQKINFLPQVKLWNAAEFNSRKIWQDSSLGSMTYDGSLNKFAVTLMGKSVPEWKFLLTSDSSTANAVTSLRLMLDSNNYYDVEPGLAGILNVYTGSLYDGTNNPMATMADVQSAVAGASILGLKMDSSYIHTDSSFLHLKSDPSNPYEDRGDDTPGAKVNPLATVGTVQAAIRDLGDIFDLQGVYTNPYTPQGSETPITTFEALLTYLVSLDPVPFEVKKGAVIVFGNEEYVLLDDQNYTTLIGWEKLGNVDSDTVVISIGGQSGVIALGDGLYMNDSSLTLITANDTSLGGLRTGHVENLTDASTNHNFALKLGGNPVQEGQPADTPNRGYVTIPIVTGADGDASYGIVPNEMLAGNSRIYSVTLNPSTLSNVGIHYDEIKSVNITHTIGTADLVTNVYKFRAGKNGDAKLGRQLVYVDEIIAGKNSILVDFGSPEAFIGCQDTLNGNYLGYIIVIAAAEAINLNRDASTTFTVNVDPDGDDNQVHGTDQNNDQITPAP